MQFMFRFIANIYGKRKYVNNYIYQIIRKGIKNQNIIHVLNIDH